MNVLFNKGFVGFPVNILKKKKAINTFFFLDVFVKGNTLLRFQYNQFQKIALRHLEILSKHLINMLRDISKMLFNVKKFANYTSQVLNVSSVLNYLLGHECPKSAKDKFT